MSNPVEATDEMVRDKLAQVVAEYTSGIVGAIPEADDFEAADGIMEALDARLSD